MTGSNCDANSAGVFGNVFEVNAEDGPIGAELEPVGPFDDDDGVLGEKRRLRGRACRDPLRHRYDIDPRDRRACRAHICGRG